MNDVPILPRMPHNQITRMLASNTVALELWDGVLLVAFGLLLLLQPTVFEIAPAFHVFVDAGIAQWQIGLPMVVLGVLCIVGAILWRVQTRIIVTAATVIFWVGLVAVGIVGNPGSPAAIFYGWVTLKRIWALYRLYRVVRP